MVNLKHVDIIWIIHISHQWLPFYLFFNKNVVGSIFMPVCNKGGNSLLFLHIMLVLGIHLLNEKDHLVHTFSILLVLCTHLHGAENFDSYNTEG